MPFDAATYPQSLPASTNAMNPASGAEDLCPVWTAQNPDRALAFLFVAPQDCTAVDVLLAL